MSGAAAVVAHGYTMRDLDTFARSVVSNNRTWWPAGDRDDLYAAAWHGIVERLYSTDDRPSRIDLLEAGRAALTEDVKATIRHHGARRDGTNNGQRYAMYWDWAGRATPSHETGLVEREALGQILDALTARQREAFTALAATGDYAEAALLLGIADQTFRSLLGRARDSFRGLWHEGEAPSRHWGCDRRAGSVRGTVGKGESAVYNLRRRQRVAARKEAAA
ncbi:sigma factor-like helix-turn-helix DNA-binding protein [Streptomyces sp. NPDC059340]|uniref:sigma-70 region 4 domain-containing protein n=1 Tax=Streptomyces sp. NPDC059340 TaxID=3346806 RepID=UPI00367AD418